MKEKVVDKLDQSEDSIKIVRENLPPNFDEFKSLSKLEKDGIYKNIESAIQNILDICAIILKKEDLRVPSSDEDMLEELEEGNILDKDIAELIKKMKGFRNFLVHRYGKINDEIAYKDIKKGLNDFERIFKEIKDYFFD